MTGSIGGSDLSKGTCRGQPNEALFPTTTHICEHDQPPDHVCQRDCVVGFVLAAVQSVPDPMTTFVGVLTSMFTSYSTIPGIGDPAISSGPQVAILDTARVSMISGLQQLMNRRHHQTSSRPCQRSGFRHFRSHLVGLFRPAFRAVPLARSDRLCDRRAPGVSMATSCSSGFLSLR